MFSVNPTCSLFPQCRRIVHLDCQFALLHAVLTFFQTTGKEALAIDSYARALRQMPTIIADNGGYDSAELVSQLRAAHARGDVYAGLDMSNGTMGDMKVLGVCESFLVKNQVVLSASEAAEMLMRVDEIVKAPPRPRDEGHH